MNEPQETLHLLLERAVFERDAAQARAARAAENARRLVAQTEQLLGHRDEYQRRAPALGGREASIALLRVHRDFMQRLDQAIVQLRDQLDANEREVAALRQVLLACEMRVAAVKKLIERRQREHDRDAERIEQRHADEAATRLAWSARSSVATD